MNDSSEVQTDAASARQSPAEPAADEKFTRRSLLFGAGTSAIAGLIVGTAGATGVALASSGARRSDANEGPVAAAGAHQAGVQRPTIPQQHCLVAVGDLDTTGLAATLAAIGTRILQVTDAKHPVIELTPDGPGDVTVTVGLGASALATTAHPALAEAVTLPAFAGDAELPPDRRGGGILLSVNSSDPGVLEPVLQSIIELIPGFHLNWSDFGFRGPVDGGVTRNPFGYHDGIIVPHTPAEFDADVWVAGGPLAGGSICVIRRFALDTESFRALPSAQRDAIIGRRQVTGEPLSGGARGDEVDLLAKAANGELLVPAKSHVRAAHPSFTGSALMLRRSYNYRSAGNDHGHLFISFQADAQTFTRTQLRLDETDDLMTFSTPTATAGFAVLPGFTAGRPLGATLF